MQRFIRSAIKVIVTGLFYLSFIQPVVSQTTNQGSYLSIDQLTDQLEHKYHVQFFYDPGWFEMMTFNSSILRLSFGEVLDRIKSEVDLSIFTIDRRGIQKLVHGCYPSCENFPMLQYRKTDRYPAQWKC